MLGRRVGGSDLALIVTFPLLGPKDGLPAVLGAFNKPY